MAVNYERIGKRIQELRKLKKMSQADLAEYTGMSVSYISHIETGIKHASLESVVRIANALGITGLKTWRGSTNTLDIEEVHIMFEYFVYCYGTEFIGLILCALFGCMGFAANRVYKNHVNDETKRSIARVVVQFVEQTWKTIHGPEKLAKALETAEVLLRKKGIPFDAEEMTVLIEAAVAEFNEAFKAPLLREDTEEATNDPGEYDDIVIPRFCRLNDLRAPRRVPFFRCQFHCQK